MNSPPTEVDAIRANLLTMLGLRGYNENQVTVVSDTGLSRNHRANPLERLELRQLRLMNAILRELNLSRVADQLGVSQQTVSEQLKRLREIFDDRLFIRTSNGVIPTPLAERLAPKLDEILNNVAALLRTDEFDPAQHRGIFTISATDFEQRVVLPVLLKQLRQQAPDIKVVVLKLEIDRMAQQLQTGEVDLVFSTPGFVPDNSPSMLLYREHYVCVCCQHTDMLHSANKPLEMEELAALPQLVVSPSRGDLRGMADSWFEQFGLERNVVLSVPSFAAAAECIASTNTVAFLPSRLLPDPRLKTLPIVEQPPGFDVIAAWHTRSSQDPLHKWIRALLAQQFPSN
ncbi:LysR family transcriptional regulator [Microbulbifer sp. VAAF005]|uniref:LysR family transcriptional regulator n=1 Tax=Microbulbifer sp. VAAF005 TaxID=3034230 RepID=UPI0024ADE2F8|nr:LysR family transcriptional regulator [Microbulbifer sp. VAAF005]WHI45001.1 LysR family transcriptional regulator [Microbulbifer sp. VAAF005]